VSDEEKFTRYRLAAQELEARLRAEVERLRGLIRDILGGCDCVHSTADGECDEFAAARAALAKGES